MKALLLLLIYPFIVFSQPVSDVFSLKFISMTGILQLDSLSASLEVNDTDTTVWVSLFDSTAVSGGLSLVLYSDEDSVAAMVRAQWSSFDTKSKSGAIFQSFSVLDSIASGFHTSATRNPTSSPILFRKPSGATRVRFLITTGNQVGQYSNLNGQRRIPKLRGHIVRMKR